MKQMKIDIEVCEDCPYNTHPCPEGCSKRAKLVAQNPEELDPYSPHAKWVTSDDGPIMGGKNHGK